MSKDCINISYNCIAVDSQLRFLKLCEKLRSLKNTLKPLRLQELKL